MGPIGRSSASTPSTRSGRRSTIGASGFELAEPLAPRRRRGQRGQPRRRPAARSARGDRDCRGRARGARPGRIGFLRRSSSEPAAHLGGRGRRAGGSIARGRRSPTHRRAAVPISTGAKRARRRRGSRPGRWRRRRLASRGRSVVERGADAAEQRAPRRRPRPPRRGPRAARPRIQRGTWPSDRYSAKRRAESLSSAHSSSVSKARPAGSGRRAPRAKYAGMPARARAPSRRGSAYTCGARSRTAIRSNGVRRAPLRGCAGDLDGLAPLAGRREEHDLARCGRSSGAVSEKRYPRKWPSADTGEWPGDDADGNGIDAASG